ncbi:MAG: murein biosynthesis integral membrane protein MurJ [Spongiibacteraceae bacterium]|jgi:putative peptidoglycan lipid II flippase|nr:murein biosynthesis integral membrane protein MurJ [Spongiibacteraceae bacterium]
MNQPVKSSRRHGLLRSSFVVSLMTMISRVLGLARDVAFAIFIGAGGAADPFFIAFKIPNFLRRLFAEGAFSQAFVPVLSEYREQRSFEQVRHLIDRVSGVLGSTLIAVTVVAVVAAPAVTALFAPGYLGDPEKFALTTDLVRITFPYLFLISMTGFSGAVLNSYGRFAPPAFAPVLLNVVLIGAAFVANRWFEVPVYALAWGVLLAGIVQWLFQMPFLARLRLTPRPKWDPKDEGVVRVLTLIVPALFGVSVSQINLLLGTVIASFLPTGSVSWLYYSDRLSELPLGVFAVAIGTVILPSLSRNRAAGSSEAFSQTLNWALRLILLIGLPAAVALFVLGPSILMTLFQYRETTPFDIRMSALSLAAIATGLTAFMLIKVLAPGFYARQDMKTPVRIGITAMVANMVLSVILVVPLHHYLTLGHVGLALATSLAAWLNAGLLYRALRRDGVLQLTPGWGRYLLQLGGACLLMAATLWWINPALTEWQQWLWWQRVGRLLGIIAAGGGVYLLVLGLGGVRPRQLRSPV